MVGDFERHLGQHPRGRPTYRGLPRRHDRQPRTARSARASSPRSCPALDDDDALLLGADLVKDTGRLLAAYDDAAGVTAEFNKNVLAVLNRELDADFDLDRFADVAHWNDDYERIEMWLRADSAQRVRLEVLDLEVDFAAGEALRTELSCKFRRASLGAELAEAGLAVEAFWTDPSGDFSLTLARPA